MIAGKQGRGQDRPQTHLSAVLVRVHPAVSYFQQVGIIPMAQPSNFSNPGRKRLGSRSWHGTAYWKQFQQIKTQFPLLRLRLYLPYRELQTLAAP
jgi:hypothetical protein